ncbi:MAG TPA: aminoacetone oxidase family FAD-binding enzyme [candidate division Zixibacteria bacterium]|jgi:predicted Rossmann fold flavoprotein
MRRESCDIAIIGAGAAGLAAAVFAGARARKPDARIILIESARRPGAKILVSGGGRCNVTNDVVTADDFWGGSRHTIAKVLQAFSNEDTVAWFHRMGVPLKLESTGKYFPTSDQAQTVLSALLAQVAPAGVDLTSGERVTDVRLDGDGFLVQCKSIAGQTSMCRARRVIVATGGLSLPKSGSDGAGLSIMQRLGHTIIPTTPALTPLVLRSGASVGGRFSEFRGITMDARLRLCRGRRTQPIIELTGSLVFTHFGVSGPVAMNLSRHWLRARMADRHTSLRVVFGVPTLATIEQADQWLLKQARAHPRRSVETALSELLPDRIAQAIVAEFNEQSTLSQLPSQTRRQLALQLVELELDVVDTRGYSHAEATAGGVDLREIEWRTMESRKMRGLHLCGEILDVDGRIGGFNFQWAWSTGFLAGRGAAEALGR